jgi:cobalt/nickel transport system permease protein
MIYIDKYAYTSKLKQKDPMCKLVFSIVTLGVCLWADFVVLSVLIVLIMGWYTVRKGGIPLAVFIRLMLLPMTFLVVGVLTIALNISYDRSAFLFYVSAFGTHIGVSIAGMQSAVIVFFKSLGAVSCLYYLSLNTPMVDLLNALARIKIPKLFIELMGLIYRSIFVLLETVDTMITAQKSRVGYSSFSSGYRSLAVLAATLFIRSYKRSNELYTALEARGYEGEINVLGEPLEAGRIQYIEAVVINLFLVFITLLLRHYTG